MEVIVDLQRILQGRACFYLIMHDEPLVLAHQWFQAGAHRPYRKLAGRIQLLEQGLSALSWHEDRLYVTNVETCGRPAPQLVVVPRRDSQVERHCHRPAFHDFLHDVPEDDLYVRSLGRGRNHEAATERLDMRGLNAIPHFLGRDRCADECIPIAADLKKALHVLLSQVGLDEMAERAEELRQSAVRRQKLLDVAPCHFDSHVVVASCIPATMSKTHLASCFTPEGLTLVGNFISVLRAQMVNQHGLRSSSKAINSNITDINNIIVMLVVRCLVGKARDVGILRCRYTCRQQIRFTA